MTPEQFAQKLDAIRGKIPAIVQASLEGGVNRTYAEMDNRIFNSNKTISNTSFGGYESEAYKELRAAQGLQTSEKDLFVHGNLKRSMKTSLKKRAVVVDTGIKVTSTYTRKRDSKRGKRGTNVTYVADPEKVMEGQEQQIVGTKGKGIFEASDKEVKQSMAVVNKIFKQLMVEALGTV